jgi:hypothetical protein
LIPKSIEDRYGFASLVENRQIGNEELDGRFRYGSSNIYLR